MPKPNEQVDALIAPTAKVPSTRGSNGPSRPAPHADAGDRDLQHPRALLLSIAKHVVRDLAAASSCDIGCGSGFLVEALADLGVDAHGVDVSESRIAQARADIRDRCRVSSALEPLGRRYDVITCVDVIEHIPAKDAEAVIENICNHTDDVIFSSAPSGYGEEEHLNIHSPDHWAELFARFAFHHDVAYDTIYVSPSAMRFRRARDPVPRLIRDYERELWRLREETRQGHELVVAQAAEIAGWRTSESAIEHRRTQADNRRLREEAQRLSTELGGLQRHLLAAIDEARSLRESGAGRLAIALQRSALRVAPPGTRRRQTLKRTVRAGIVLRSQGPSGLRRALREDAQIAALPGIFEQYDEWRSRHEPSWADLNRMRHDNRTWAVRPLVSILMTTYNPEPEWLNPAIDSVVGQVYENWELCIADDGSTAPHVKEILTRRAADDPRIKVVIRPGNGGMVAASTSAFEIATGEFVGLLDHDDLLRPHALHAVVERLQTVPDADVIYSDEDMLLEDGSFAIPHFKPDWSPDLLLSVNYICHFMVIRRALVERVGGFRPGFDGAQDHDLVLRATEKARRIEHIPDVLYAWRQVPGSVALEADAKMYAYEAGVRSLEEALTRRGLVGCVSMTSELGRYHVRLEVHDNPHVAIVIPTRDRVDLLRECIESVESLSTYTNWSITIIDNDSTDPKTLAYLEDTRHRVVRFPGHFNYSRLINFGRTQVDAPYLLTLNNDVTVISPDWMEALLEQGQRPEIGVVGGRMLYPGGRPQSEGIAIGNVRGGYIAANLDAHWLGRIMRNVSAVTGACQLIKTSVFDEVNGYDEELQVGFNDVDFCLRAQRAGYRVLYTPHAEMMHRESATRGKLDPAADYALFWSKWGRDGGIHDPYLSPHIRDLSPLQLRLDPLPVER